jgi:hypothetical protein
MPQSSPSPESQLEVFVNRKILVIVIVIVVALVCLTSAGFGISWWFKDQQPTAQGRALVSKLAYCNSNNEKPCIVSFSVDADGSMLVNMLIPAASYPYFYLTIGNASTTNRYDCQQVEDFPTNIYCTGAEMYPGEALQFNVVTLKDDTVLAEGNFAIIGLQLPNPQQAGTETPLAVGTPYPNETPTELLLELPQPFPTLSTTPDPFTSYPNPESTEVPTSYP